MDWKKMVGTVAPMLGTALGGPFGGMAGKWLADQMGVDESELETAVLSADPNKLMQIKSLETQFTLEMKRIGISEEQLHVQDRSDARKMASNTSLLPQAVIASIFICGFVVVLYGVFSGVVTLEGNQLNMANILIGILSAGIMQIMNFFFGSSSGSKEKTHHLASR